MDASLGPLLYCLCIIAGCALYFHYNCEDRRCKADMQPAGYAMDESVQEEPQEGEETKTEERPTKRQRLTDWASRIFYFNTKAE